ncbi:hypothetical protein Tco_0199295 [Tanacetum coccineum]
MAQGCWMLRYLIMMLLKCFYDGIWQVGAIGDEGWGNMGWCVGNVNWVVIGEMWVRVGLGGVRDWNLGGWRWGGGRTWMIGMVRGVSWGGGVVCFGMDEVGEWAAGRAMREGWVGLSVAGEIGIGGALWGGCGWSNSEADGGECGTDKAKTTRKRLKPGKHEYGNGKARKKLDKSYQSQTVVNLQSTIGQQKSNTKGQKS